MGGLDPIGRSRVGAVPMGRPSAMSLREGSGRDTLGGMADAVSTPVTRPNGNRGRWTSFEAAAPRGSTARALEEAGNPDHRVRVEHDQHTLLVHISGEDGSGWTTLALDRATREWSIAQRKTQLEAATAAYEKMYGETPPAGPGPAPTAESATAPDMTAASEPDQDPPRRTVERVTEEGVTEGGVAGDGVAEDGVAEEEDTG